ncbi:MAG: DUF3737 family protein [Lachnospiraceae bacterium]|nr:DUF3737 family protein [Lachnospiraceae bacterium]
MKEIRQQEFFGERPLYATKDARIIDCMFGEGESPLKESGNIEVEGCTFGWKYPLWYCNNVKVDNCTWLEMGRSGVWYTRNISVNNSLLHAPKNFRRCDGVMLTDVVFNDAKETFWSCKNVKLKNVTAKGDYFAMNSENLDIDGLVLDGNYFLDGAKNAVVRNSKLISKDAFWNCENITVYDSYISGEYLGWNSKNVQFINCTIESDQGMCYIDDLVLENCKLVNTTLAFEYSNVDADVTTSIDSVFNPYSGRISAPMIDELIVENDKVDPAKTQIDCGQIRKVSERPEWLR